MASLILTEKLSRNIRPTYSERRYEINFDGYKQTMPVGMNASGSEWSLEWDGLTLDQVRQLKEFFQSHKGTTRIQWMPPTETVVQQFTCVTHTPRLKTGTTWIYTATLVQEFLP